MATISRSGIRRPHAERGRNGPAERARLAAVDPMARLVDVQELGGCDLRQADGRDIADVLAEDLVHLLVDPLRLDRRFLEVRSTQHRPLSLAAFAEPLAPILQGLLRLQFARGFDKQFERGLGVRDDPEVGIEDAADLGRLDVDMNELAPFGVDVDRSGVTIRPAIAEAKHEVGLEHRRVAVAVGRLQPDHADHQRVVVGNRSPTHQCRNHGNAGQLGEFHELTRTRRR